MMMMMMMMMIVMIVMMNTSMLMMMMMTKHKDSRYSDTMEVYHQLTRMRHRSDVYLHTGMDVYHTEYVTREKGSLISHL